VNVRVFGILTVAHIASLLVTLVGVALIAASKPVASARVA
jgi:hypothetical protein